LYCEELALTEMRQTYQNCNATSDNLDQKSTALLSSASLILGLFGVLQLETFKAGQSPVYWFMLIVAVALYIGMLVLCTNSIMPRDYMTPIKSDWNVLGEYILAKAPRDAVLTLLNGYVTQIPRNRQQNDAKAERIRWASWCLVGIVIVLLALSMIQGLGI
jgi:hypothetical protein